MILLGVIAYVVVVALTPPGRWARLGSEAVLLAAALALARVPPRWALGRLALLAPFFLIVLVSVPSLRPPEEVSRAAFVGSVAYRGLLSFGALAVLARSVEPPELLAALGRLRVPPVLIALIALMLRYLHLLEEEARRMIRARDARGTPRALRDRARVAGHMVGSLFVRSYERAERLSQAMLARGFDGTLVRHAPEPLSARDRAVGLALALALAALVVLT